MPVVPHRFLFRYSIPVKRLEGIPRKGASLLALPADAALPDFGELDGLRPFAEIRAAWNVEGLGISVQVTGKKMPLDCDPKQPAESDGLQIWIDTRSTQTIHRASRFCHHFCFLPSGGGKKGDEATVLQVPIALAREDAPRAKPGSIRVQRTDQKSGYLLEAWISADALQGYEPESNPKLGFYYSLRDAELGEQNLIVSRELPFAHDPSLWATLELA
ncbi:MAG: hypothetical protein AB7O26_10890 [Planctomycetaceae bacterium]